MSYLLLVNSDWMKSCWISATFHIVYHISILISILDEISIWVRTEHIYIFTDTRANKSHHYSRSQDCRRHSDGHVIWCICVIKGSLVHVFVRHPHQAGVWCLCSETAIDTATERKGISGILQTYSQILQSTILNLLMACQLQRGFNLNKSHSKQLERLPPRKQRSIIAFKFVGYCVFVVALRIARVSRYQNCNHISQATHNTTRDKTERTSTKLISVLRLHIFPDGSRLIFVYNATTPLRIMFVSHDCAVRASVHGGNRVLRAFSAPNQTTALWNASMTIALVCFGISIVYIYVLYIAVYVGRAHSFETYLARIMSAPLHFVWRSTYIASTAAQL